MRLPSAERVLVTGGAGFIGHRVVEQLVDQGCHAAVVDNLTVGMPMPGPHPAITPIEADIRDRTTLDRVFKETQPSAVVHLAAVHHIPTCERERAYALDVNVVGSENVLASCEAHGVKLVVMASSGAVYAPIDGSLVEDTTPLEAIDNYSLCKIANEAQGRLWTERTGGLVRAARIFNTVGHDDPNGHLIPDILAQVKPGSRSAVIGLGNTRPRRDYIHADDTAAGLVALLKQGAVEAPFEAFNISRGEEYSVVDIVRVIGEVLGVELTPESDPTRIRRVDRPSLLGSRNKTRDRTGWSPALDFQAMISRALLHGREAT